MNNKKILLTSSYVVCGLFFFLTYTILTRTNTDNIHNVDYEKVYNDVMDDLIGKMNGNKIDTTRIPPNTAYKLDKYLVNKLLLCLYHYF